MSMVRFLTPRYFFGSNRRLSSTSRENGILRVPWPSIFNFLPKRSLIRRKPPRNDRGRGLSYTRCFASLGARLLSLALEAGLSLPPRPFFKMVLISGLSTSVRGRFRLSLSNIEKQVPRTSEEGHGAEGHGACSGESDVGWCGQAVCVVTAVYSFTAVGK